MILGCIFGVILTMATGIGLAYDAANADLSEARNVSAIGIVVSAMFSIPWAIVASVPVAAIFGMLFGAAAILLSKLRSKFMMAGQGCTGRRFQDTPGTHVHRVADH